MAIGKLDEQAHPSKEYDRPSSGYDQVPEEERDVEVKIDEEQDLQGASSNGNARGQEEESEQKCLSTCSKYRKLIIGIGIGIGIGVLLIIIGILATFLSIAMKNQKIQAVQIGTPTPLNRQKDAIKYQPCTCSYDWIAYQGHCYKLFEEEKNWSESKTSCISHNASLAKITEKAIKRMFTRDHVFWIGLKRGPVQLWKWLDGENATEKIMGNGGDCALLDNDDIMSVRCSNKHYYMCQKKILLRDPERELEV